MNNTTFAGNRLGISHLYEGYGTDYLSSDDHHIHYEKEEYDVGGISKSVDELPWGANLSVLFTKIALMAHTGSSNQR